MRRSAEREALDLGGRLHVGLAGHPERDPEAQQPGEQGHEQGHLQRDRPRLVVDPDDLRLDIRGLADEGTTVIVTTHYMDEAERFDRLAFLSRGKLKAVGTPAEVKSSFGEGQSLEDIFVALQEADES